VSPAVGGPRGEAPLDTEPLGPSSARRSSGSAVRYRHPRNARSATIRAVAVLGLWAAGSRAAIPEPDVVFHGIPRLNGNVLAPGDQISIAIGSEVLRVYVIGQPQGAGTGRYVLRVPLVQLDVGEARPAERAGR
jgi:hypothetical protein